MALTPFKLTLQICCLLVCAPLCMAQTPAVVEQLQKQLSAAQEQVEDLSGMMESLKREMKDQEAEVGAMRGKAVEMNASARKRLVESEQETVSLKAKLAESDKLIRQLQKDLADKTKRLAETETALTKSSQDRKPGVEAAAMFPPLSSPKNQIDPVYAYLPQKKLNASYERVLESVKPVLTANPQTVIRLTGHSNQEGSEDASLKLSAQRAESLAAYLTKRGVSRQSLQVVAAGSLHPLFPPASAEGRKLNRRVEVEVLK